METLSLFTLFSAWRDNQINHLLAQEEAYRRELPDELRDVLIQLSLKEQIA